MMHKYIKTLVPSIVLVIEISTDVSKYVYTLSHHWLLLRDPGSNDTTKAISTPSKQT